MPAKVDNTAKSRAARFKAKMQAKGLVQMQVWIRDGYTEELRALVQKLADNPDLEISSAPLRSISTGRVVKC